MTKREALMQTKKIWTLIAKKDIDKHEALTQLGLNLRMLASCPCCEYVYLKCNNNCSFCPIKWTEINKSDHAFPCLSQSSPYSLWRKANTAKEREKQALKIVELAKEALKKDKKP